MVSLRLLPAVLLGAAALGAQTPTWNAPASGHVYDPVTRAVRPIVGTIGAAWAGPPSIREADWASVAPNGQAALVLREEQLEAVADLADPEKRSSLFQAVAAVPEAAWSADSRRAVLLLGARLIRISGFDGAPLIEEETLPDIPEGERWRLLAADDAADRVALSADGLWIAGRTAPPRAVEGIRQPSAAAFAHGSTALFAVDVSAGRILRVDVSGVVEAVADEAAAALLVSPGDELLWAAAADNRSLRAWRLSTGAAAAELAAPAAELAFTSAGPLRVLVNRRASAAEPFLYLDFSAVPKLTFVPAGDVAP